MFLTMLRTMDLPAPDRFPWWREQLAKATVPTVVSSPHAADFRAEVILARMGPVDLSILTHPEARAVRTPALVRRSDPGVYGLCLITANEVHLAQRDRECRVGPSDLLLYDTSQPYDARALPGPGTRPGRMLVLQLPKDALPLPPQQLNRLLARRMPAGTGMNAVLAAYLTRVATAIEKAEVTEQEAGRLGEVALHLAAAALASQIEAEDLLTPETRGQALLAQIEAFIEYNLGDPDLTPAVIADHHHISVSYLHKLFQPRDLTAAAWIRRRRLEHARADLTDPRLRSHPVQLIAARWGFRHAAHFSRAFRTVYGMSPRDCRHRVQGWE
ncbi:AraC-like DNA-binding protein [Catenulispora sp. GAS73]